MTASMRRRPTSQDVANLAGVSRATVSFVLNDKPGQTIPEPTRERVWSAARSLGYTIHPFARALRQGSRIVLSVHAEWPYGVVLDGFRETLDQVCAANAFTHLSATCAPGRTLADLLNHVEPALIVRIGTATPEEQALLQERRLPYLLTAGVTLATYDDYLRDISRLQVAHLRARGHQRMGYIGLLDSRIDEFDRPRQDGFVTALAAAGLPTHWTTRVALDPSALRPVLDDWHREGITALCCFNDHIGRAVLRAAHDAGLHIPADMAVVGVDNDSQSEWSVPSLSSIATEAEASLRPNLDRALRAVLAGAPHEEISTPVAPVLARTLRVVVRESCGADVSSVAAGSGLCTAPIVPPRVLHSAP